jgi:hypothetical protein
MRTTGFMALAPVFLFDADEDFLWRATIDPPLPETSKDLCVAPHSATRFVVRLAPSAKNAIIAPNLRVTGSPPFHGNHADRSPHAHE